MSELNWPPHAPSPCPTNSFGMGNVELTQEDRILHLKLWDDWESQHPEDPTGEVYLRQYNEKAKMISPLDQVAPQLITPPPPQSSVFVKHKLKGRPVTMIVGEYKTVRYNLPRAVYEALCERALRDGETLTAIIVRAVRRELTEGKQ